jgi:imidazolonepropionase-like amidohydrolase
VSVYHLHATLLPHGDTPVDLWVRSGHITFLPTDGAEPLSGKFVLPGLVDAHVHLTMDPGGSGLAMGSAELVRHNRQAHLDSGVLLLRDIGAVSDASRGLDGSDGLPPVVAAGRFLAPEGRYLGFQEMCEPGSLCEAGVAQVRAGASWVKVILDWARSEDGRLVFGSEYPSYELEEMRALVSAVHEHGGRVAVHSMGVDGARIAVEAGVDSIEHGWGLTAGLVERMAVQRTAWTPTLAMLLDAIETLERKGRDAGPRRETFSRLSSLLPQAQQLGVTVLAGTDVLPPGSIAREIAALEQAGLDQTASLAAASIAGRAYLGCEGLVEGARADLLIWDTDPRQSGSLSAPDAIMLGGRLVGSA